jgi:hypothetical protein
MSAPAPVKGDWSYPYTPFPKQLEFHQCTSDEVLFGGAGGPGKTDAVLARAVTMCVVVANCKVLLLRRTFAELEAEIIPRLRSRIPSWVAHYSSQGRVFTFAHNKSRLQLGYLERDDDMYRYIGAEYQLIIWDELTQQNRRPYVFLRSRLRMAGQVADDMHEAGWRPQMIATTNPGGRGHSWVKAMFVDPAPPGVEHVAEDRLSRTYIPARARDNPALDLAAYEKQLMSMDPDMRRAIMDGDWSVLEGVRFSQFRYGVHVIEPHEVALDFEGMALGVGVDWGIQDPFVALWGALLPDRRLVVYRELYQSNLTSAQQALLIRDSERPDERIPGRPIPIALDPSCWNRQSESGLPPVDKDAPPVGSIAHYYRGVFGGAVRKAENARISGWALVDEYLRVREDGLPGLLIYDTCRNLIRDLPSVQRSNTNPEDVDTKDPGDHSTDALRYLLQLMVGGRGLNGRVSVGSMVPPASSAALARAGF